MRKTETVKANKCVDERRIEMKRVFKSRFLVSAVITALLCSLVTLFTVEAPSSAETAATPLAPTLNAAVTPMPADDFLPPDFAKSEAEGIAKFAALLSEYKDQFGTLRTDARPDPKQITAVESKLKNLKSLFPQFQSNARAVVTKLKNARKWTSELDSYFEVVAPKHNASPEFLEVVKAGGGFRSTLEKSIASLGKFSVELDQDQAVLNEIRTKKVSWLNWFDSLLIPTAHASIGQFSCDTCLTLLIAMEISCGLFHATGCAATSAAYFAGGCTRSACRHPVAKLASEPKLNLPSM
jgi:hypothetical protein